MEDASADALTALVAARVCDWEADDDPELRDERTQELERALARDGRSIADRLKIIEALPASLMDFAFGLPSFQQWMFSAPKAALDWMSSHPGISDARILTLFQDWGEKSRQELRRYLAALPEGEWKQKAMAAASYEALPGDPVEAINRTRQMNAGGPQTGLLEIATAEWARRDPEAAGRWVSQVSEPVLREELTGSFAVGCADIAPDLAAAWTIGSLPPGKILARSIAEIAGTWAKQDPAAVGAWVARFPDGESRLMAVASLLNAWIGRDRPAAIAWIRELPDATLRMQAAEFVDPSSIESASEPTESAAPTETGR